MWDKKEKSNKADFQCRQKNDGDAVIELGNHVWIRYVVAWVCLCILRQISYVPPRYSTGGTQGHSSQHLLSQDFAHPGLRFGMNGPPASAG